MTPTHHQLINLSSESEEEEESLFSDDGSPWSAHGLAVRPFSRSPVIEKAGEKHAPSPAKEKPPPYQETPSPFTPKEKAAPGAASPPETPGPAKGTPASHSETPSPSPVEEKHSEEMELDAEMDISAVTTVELEVGDAAAGAADHQPVGGERPRQPPRELRHLLGGAEGTGSVWRDGRRFSARHSQPE
jgi:hypothetical protein